MKYYILGMSLLCLLGCSSQENNTNTSSKNAAPTEKAQVCAGCHNPSAQMGAVEAPSLAGRPYDELVAEIQNVHEYYVSQPSLMHDFKEDDIHGIATYFSNLK